MVRKGTCTFFYIAVDTPNLCTLLVPTPFIKSYTALCNVIGPIAIDFTFIHCTYVLYIFNIKVEISYLMVYRFCRHTCSCMMVWRLTIIEVETGCQIIKIRQALTYMWLKTTSCIFELDYLPVAIFVKPIETLDGVYSCIHALIRGK